MRIVVVFPAPFGPSRPKTSPRPDGEADAVDGDVIAEPVAEVVDDEGVPAHC